MNKFIIGTGFYSNANALFHQDCWAKCIQNYYHNVPIYNICLAGSIPPTIEGLDIRNIRLEGNPGYIGQLISGEKQNTMAGWSSTVLALAMLAYCNESDLVYLEEDVIFKGDVIAKMYEDMGDKEFVFGKRMVSPPYMPCAQSLFLVKHSFLLRFVSYYANLEKETHGNLPEDKFCKIGDRWPHSVTCLSFGVDRERAIPWDDEYWYAQKLTPEEIAEAKRRGIC